MNKCQLYTELLKIKRYLQTIEDNSDLPYDKYDLDAVTEAQYGIQDTMAKITDDLLEVMNTDGYICARCLGGDEQ